MASLAELRRRIKEQQDKENSKTSFHEKVVYRHWDIKENQTAVVRFLPDADESNPYFWKKRTMFNFPFNGMINVPDMDATGASKEVYIKLPSLAMYGLNKQDRVLNEVSPWFKDPSLEEMAYKYWFKKTYYYQGFVIEDPLDEKDSPENPIRRFILTPQIQKLIENSLQDPEIEELPTDTIRGLLFRITKIKNAKGQNDYTTSSWSRKEHALTDEHLAAIEEYGLVNLSDLIPSIPSKEQQDVIFEMFEASVEGQPYDYDRWGEFYTPYGVQRKETATKPEKTDEPATVREPVASKPEPKAEPAPEPEKEPEVVTVAEEKPVNNQNTNNLLKQIRERQMAAAATANKE